jgi:hypothetical protein
MASKPASKPEPGLPTTGMLNRRCSPRCPLHGVWGVAWDENDSATWGKQHIHAELLWSEVDGRKGWEKRVATQAAALGVTCTPDQARDHYVHHRVEQPMMTGFNTKKALAEAAQLSPLAKEILVAVYRARFLALDQIVEAFFGDYHTSGGGKWKAKMILSALTRKHFLYRFYPDPEWPRIKDQPRQFHKQALFFLGRNAVPFIETAEGRSVSRNNYITRASEVHANPVVGKNGKLRPAKRPYPRFIHDYRCNQLWVAAHRTIREQQGLVRVPATLQPLVGTDLLACDVPVNNWHGAKTVTMSFYDRFNQVEQEMQPDMLMSLNLPRSAWLNDNSLPSCQLPFFVEYDHGSRSYRGDLNKDGEREVRTGVADQLLSYHRLAMLRKAGERFPDLNVKGYSVPVVMVFSNAARLKGIQKAFLEHAESQGFTDRGAPIFLVTEEDWLANPFQDGIITSAWRDDGQRYSLIELLVRASRQLIASRQLPAGKELGLNMDGAKRTVYAQARASATQRKREQTSADTPPTLPGSANAPSFVIDLDSSQVHRDVAEAPSFVIDI